MSSKPRASHPLAWTGERYVPEVAGNIRLEHLHRYYFARELVRGARVLDIACGEGYGADLLAETARCVTGVDIAPDAIAHARGRYRRPNLAFTVGACGAIPLASGTCDVVVSFETLEHHGQHDEMLDEIRRVLRPGGLAIVSSPDRHEYADVPGYQNPFHVRELYRDELEHLLRTHFRHVALAGQRIRAGSMIGPLGRSTRTAFVSYQQQARGVRRAPGFEAPMYLIACASDRELPTLPVGVLDGGEFVWSTDHADAMRAAHDQAAFQTAALAAATADRDTRLDLLQAEIARRDQMLVDWGAANGRAEAQAASLADALREREARLAAIEADAGARTSALTAAITEARARIAALEQEIDARDRRIAESVGLSAQLQRALSEARVEIDALAAHRALAHVPQAATGVDQRSQSWRLEQPLREARRAVGRYVARVRPGLSHASRAIYRGVPLPLALKMRIKGALFTIAPGLVRHTVAYRAWQVHTRSEVRSRLQSQSRSRSRSRPQPPSPSPPQVPSASASLPPWFYDDHASDYVPLTATEPVESAIELIAFYLPQFHPIPENDRWWGKGFTEWTSVSRGRPRFPGHYQPHLPGELGFYDLRSIDVQRRQIELARLHGLRGFCYHHYWFGGTRLLRTPLEHLLADPTLDFPFCLCWANENWTRRWDGKEHEVLMAQQHSPEDDLAFIRDIEPALRDPRYIRVAGRPLLIVYRPALLPDARATAARWRAYCREAGLGELLLVTTHAFDWIDPRTFGFDAALEFAPNNMGAAPIAHGLSHLPADFRGRVFDYRHFTDYCRQYRPADYPLFRGVTPMWDNEPRRPGHGTLFLNASPARYRDWLEHACRDTLTRLPDMPLVFVNAWNEWAEGAHLEPDQRHGYAYLQATAEALRQFPPQTSASASAAHAPERAPQRTGAHDRIALVSHDAHFHGAQLVALHLAETLSHDLRYVVDILLCGDGVLRPDFERAGRVHDCAPRTTTRDQRIAIARRLHDDGVRLALCNTSVVGDMAEILKQAGMTVIALVHELPGLIKEHGLDASIAQLARHADRVVFPAQVVRDAFVAATGLDRAKTVVRPQGLFAHNTFADRRTEARCDVRARLGLSDTTRIVLACGYGDDRKGLDLFVDVGLRLMAMRDDVAFVWVGHHEPGAFARAQAQLADAERAVAARFLFPGPIRDSDVFFAGADAFLLTSREDPFPMVVLHALDASLPVVAFDDAGGFVELLRRGCGLLVPYLDTIAMTDALHRLLDDEPGRERLTSVGRDILARELSFVDYARSLVDLAQPATPRPLTISVIVPNYNYARYLPARLRSILAQARRPSEIVFLDDGSTDESVEVAERLLRDGGVPYRILRNDEPQGCYRQWLRGMREATGDLIWIAEADDDCAASLLETLASAFERQGDGDANDVVLAYCQSRQIDADGRELAPDYLDYTADVDHTKWRRAYVRRGVEEIRDTLIVKNTIPNASAVLMRRPDLSSIEPMLSTLAHAGDWLVYVHLLERGSIAFFPQALNDHRRHHHSLTIGRGGIALLREALQVQQHIRDRHAIAEPVEQQRLRANQATYTYLQLDRNGPASFAAHDALKDLVTCERAVSTV